MPNAAPLPGAPGHLALFGAADLLASAGCPVCRYVAAASDRFLGWFALEGHAEAGVITRLCESLGLCPVHTRGLLGQPGADGRLTAVYRYLLQAGVRQLAGGAPRLAPCLACTRDADATGRALDTVLTGLAEEDLWYRYREAGGLCLPHLREAAAPGGPRLTGSPGGRSARWLGGGLGGGLGHQLAGMLGARLAARPPELAAIAGEPAEDAAIRARLRTRLPRSPAVTVRGTTSPFGDHPGACPACLAGARAEQAELARVINLAARGRLPDLSWPGLCSGHLQEICQDPATTPERTGGAAAANGTVAAASRLLEWQAERSLEFVRELATSRGRWRSLRRLRPARRAGEFGEGRPVAAGACPACTARHDAAESAAQLLPGLTPSSSPDRDHPPVAGPCLRHVLAVQRRDRRATGAVTARTADRAESLLRELEEAFRKRTWAHRDEPRGPEMTAWRRAAGFIDGRVYGGGMPGSLGDPPGPL